MSHQLLHMLLPDRKKTAASGYNEFHTPLPEPYNTKMERLEFTIIYNTYIYVPDRQMAEYFPACCMYEG